MTEFAKYCETPGGYAEYVLLHLFGTAKRFEQFLEDARYPPEEQLARAAEKSIEKMYMEMLSKYGKEKAKEKHSTDTTGNETQTT